MRCKARNLDSVLENVGMSRIRSKYYAKEYYTVAHEAFVEIEERKSKFIGYVKPVETAEEATAYINEIKSNHKDATHNCYAYYVCKDMFAQRFSDDGEPSGTAGIPILEVIKRNNIQNVVVVVTRYFGGILLGAPGLIRAYSKSASEAIVKATKVKRISVSYTHLRAHET